MKVLLKPSSNLTCVDIEQQLGLARGDVAQITADPSGSVQVELKKDPTPDQKAKLEKMFNMNIQET